VKSLAFRRLAGTLIFVIVTAIPLAAQQAPDVSEGPDRPVTDLTVDDVLDDFDAVWEAVAQNFYNPDFQQIDFAALLDSQRQRVADAGDAMEAYAILQETLDALQSPKTLAVPPWEVPEPTDEEEGEILLEYGGVGILLGTTVDGDVMALSIFRETPAERAGVLIGDVITRVDDWEVGGDDAIGGVVERVRGVVDTTVNLTLRDPDGVERTVGITRAQIDLRPSVVTEVRPNGTGYIRIPALTKELVDQASRSLPSLLSSRNLVLDLRGVSVGTLESMTTLAQWFLGATNVGGFLTIDGGQGLPYLEDAVAVYQRPMAVLTDSRTSGVPEMLAATLRSYRRAGLVGEKTMGNFEYSHVLELPSGGLVGVAFARFLTPDGRLPSVEGLEPDIPVELPDLATLRAGRDVFLEAAIKALEDSPRW